MQFTKRKPLIGNDLRSNANAMTEVHSIREPALIQMTPYNVSEKFITAKFLKFADLRRSYNILLDHGFDKDALVLAIIGEKEDKFFDSIDKLEKEFEDKEGKYKYVSMGLESPGKEITYYVSGVWDSNNAAKIND